MSEQEAFEKFISGEEYNESYQLSERDKQIALYIWQSCAERKDKIIEKQAAELAAFRGENSDLELGCWGRDDLMAIAAVRYCLGRRTYITGDCSDWLIAQWPNICKRAQIVIRRDIEREFLDDDAARAHGEGHKPLGDDCDRAAWEKVRLLWTPPNAELRRADCGANNNRDA